MRDRTVRLAFLGLILALPPLILATSPTRPGPGTAMLAGGIEVVLVVGLAIAGKQRQMLLSREAR